MSKKNKMNKKTMVVEQPEINQDFAPELCNHDLNNPLNSLKVFPKKNMVYPDSTFCACENCHKTFEFQKDDRGLYVKVNESG